MPINGISIWLAQTVFSRNLNSLRRVLQGRSQWSTNWFPQALYKVAYTLKLPCVAASGVLHCCLLDILGTSEAKV